MEPVETELCIHPKKDQNAASDPDSKASDIDERIPLVVLYGPQGDFKVILDHENRMLRVTTKIYVVDFEIIVKSITLNDRKGR